MNGHNIANPSLHDAELIAVAIDHENSKARIDFHLAESRHIVFELQNLKAIRAEDLILQNVVNRVLQSKDFSSEDIAYWIMWATSLSDAHSWLDDSRKREWLDAIKSERLKLLVFEPSAGAQIAAVCEQYITTESKKKKKEKKGDGVI